MRRIGLVFLVMSLLFAACGSKGESGEVSSALASRVTDARELASDGDVGGAVAKLDELRLVVLDQHNGETIDDERAQEILSAADDVERALTGADPEPTLLEDQTTTSSTTTTTMTTAPPEKPDKSEKPDKTEKPDKPKKPKKHDDDDDDDDDDD